MLEILIFIGKRMYFTQPSENNPNETVKHLVLFSSDEHQIALRDTYDVNGVHQGQKHTLAHLTQDYYWTTMAKDAISWVSIVSVQQCCFD